MIWTIARHFVPLDTKRRLNILGAVYVPSLVRSGISLKNIPSVWGGLGHGREFDNLFKWPLGTQETILIGRRDTYDVTIVLDSPETVVTWRWCLNGSLDSGINIGFSTYFAHSEGEHAPSDSDVKVEYFRVMESTDEHSSQVPSLVVRAADIKETDYNSNHNLSPAAYVSMREPGEVVFGRWKTPSKGLLQLRFDNLHSMFTSKEITLIVTATEGEVLNDSDYDDETESDCETEEDIGEMDFEDNFTDYEPPVSPAVMQPQGTGKSANIVGFDAWTKMIG